MRLGIDWADHTVPFHPSATAAPDDVPTVTQLAMPGQPTPANDVCFEPPGLGDDWMTHEVPFHRSASEVVVVKMKEVTDELPTAVHATELVHAMAASKLSWVTSQVSRM